MIPTNKEEEQQHSHSHRRWKLILRPRPAARWLLRLLIPTTTAFHRQDHNIIPKRPRRRILHTTGNAFGHRWDPFPISFGVTTFVHHKLLLLPMTIIIWLSITKRKESTCRRTCRKPQRKGPLRYPKHFYEEWICPIPLPHSCRLPKWMFFWKS